MAKLLGSVDLLGLNSFGQPVGMNPLWGMAIGGGVAGVTSAAMARSGSAKTAARADLIGFLAGIATGGVMWSMKSTRHAAFGAFAGAFFASGLKWIEGVLFGSPKPMAGRGVGLPMINALNGGQMGMPTIQALNGQMGLPSMSNVSTPQGTIPGVAGPQISGSMNGPPVHLLGQRMGGTQVSGLSARYGATLLNRG